MGGIYTEDYKMEELELLVLYFYITDKKYATLSEIQNFGQNFVEYCNYAIVVHSEYFCLVEAVKFYKEFFELKEHDNKAIIKLKDLNEEQYKKLKTIGNLYFLYIPDYTQKALLNFKKKIKNG